MFGCIVHSVLTTNNLFLKDGHLENDEDDTGSVGDIG